MVFHGLVLVIFDYILITQPISIQKWNLQKSASDYEVKIELGPVLAQFRANLSFAAPKMLLSGL